MKFEALALQIFEQAGGVFAGRFCFPASALSSLGRSFGMLIDDQSDVLECIPVQSDIENLLSGIRSEEATICGTADRGH